ncbi:MAG: amino acid permease [Acidimicrobiales bacterium]|nr:amino acid permease [Acidimicrobiales bacterium]
MSPSAGARPGDGAYHPRAQRHRDRSRGRLRLRDASAMAIGGMIGGGIFSVLGVTIELAGHLAFGCFVLAGALAALTARSYAALARRGGRSGGPDELLRAEGHPQVAALASWYLVLGYILALAVYGFTFGHYLASVLGGGEVVARVASLGVMAVFLALNLRGVGASSITEDAIVAAKLLVLALIAGVGLGRFAPDRLSPLADVGTGGLLIGAGAVFIAYEGFELLAYDYDDLDDAERTLPRSLYLSIGVVALVYVTVTIGAQMLVSDATIVAQREVAFAAAGEAALGTTGRWLAVLGAVLATSSAINATLFSTSRLVRDLTRSGELPDRLGRTRHGLPVLALWLLAAVGAALAMLPAIGDLLAFGSVTFLAVFALVNHAHARTATSRVDAVVGHLAALACAAAVAIVLADLARSDPAALAMVAGALAVVGALRALWARQVRAAS